MTDRHFEDFTVGESHDCGTATVTEADVLAFAEQYDPQPFHVDPEAAAESPYGGLIASGWHTASMTMGRYVEGFLSETATMGARGVDELRWLRPVRPGDELAVRAEVVGTEADTAPDRGLVRVRITAENQAGETVLSMVGLMLMARRDPETG